jgi:hypothetical protein
MVALVHYDTIADDFFVKPNGKRWTIWLSDKLGPFGGITFDDEASANTAAKAMSMARRLGRHEIQASLRGLLGIGEPD